MTDSAPGDSDPGVLRLEGRLADRDVWRAGNHCSIGRAMEVVGTRSAMLLMREAFYGTRRFDDFAARVGITEAVAAKRLRELVDAGLLQRAPYREPGQRTREEYLLTPKGRDLVPAALALMQWGDTYLADQPGGPLALRHSGCGADVAVEVRCTEGHAVPLEEIGVRVRRRTA
jgi:DNA-binding HxlR family transcriptional regulator